MPVQRNLIDSILAPRQKPADGTPLGFFVTDPFARIVDHSLIRRDRFSCEYSVAIDTRTADKNLEARQLTVDD